MTSDQTQHLRPLHALLIFLILVGSQIGGGFLVGVVYGVRHGMHPSNPLPAATDPLFIAWSVLAGAVISVIACFMYARAVAGPKLHEGGADGVGWRPASRAGVGEAVAAGLLLAIVVFLLQRLIPADESALTGPVSQMISGGGFAEGVAILMALGVAPPLEEFVFRGVMLTGLRARIGLWPAATVSGIAFVLMHWSDKIHYLPGFLAVALLAAVTTTMRVRHGSLVPAVVAHLVYNLTLILV